MILSRRLFLIGTAAALATIKLPPATAEVRLGVTPAPSPLPYVRRAIHDITISFDEYEKIGGAVQFNIRRAQQVLLQFVLNNQGVLRWAAVPGMEIIQRKDSPIEIDVIGRTSDGTIQITSDYYLPNDPVPITAVEFHRFPLEAVPRVEIQPLMKRDAERLNKALKLLGQGAV